VLNPDADRAAGSRLAPILDRQALRFLALECLRNAMLLGARSYSLYLDPADDSMCCRTT
jgi:hypothetical protein